jgi:hypothetical protein
MGSLEFRRLLDWYATNARLGKSHKLTPHSRLVQHQYMDDFLCKHRRGPVMVAIMDLRLGMQNRYPILTTSANNHSSATRLQLASSA